MSPYKWLAIEAKALPGKAIQDFGFPGSKHYWFAVVHCWYRWRHAHRTLFGAWSNAYAQCRGSIECLWVTDSDRRNSQLRDFRLE